MLSFLLTVATSRKISAWIPLLHSFVSVSSLGIEKFQGTVTHTNENQWCITVCVLNPGSNHDSAMNLVQSLSLYPTCHQRLLWSQNERRENHIYHLESNPALFINLSRQCMMSTTFTQVRRVTISSKHLSETSFSIFLMIKSLTNNSPPAPNPTVGYWSITQGRVTSKGSHLSSSDCCLTSK